MGPKKTFLIVLGTASFVFLTCAALTIFNIASFSLFDTLGLEFLKNAQMKFQSIPREIFIQELREDTSKGKLIFREKNSMGMLDLASGALSRTALLPGSFKTIGYLVSRDKHFLTFVMMLNDGAGEMRMILNLQTMAQNNVDLKDAYAYREAATYGLEGKKARSEFIPEAFSFSGGSSNEWLFLNNDAAQDAKIFIYDHEKNMAKNIPLPADRYDFINNKVYADPSGEFLYLIANIKHQFRMDEQDVYPDVILKIARSDFKLEVVFIASNRVHISSLGFIPNDRDRLWVYGLNTFYLVNLKTGALEDTKIIPGDTRGASHYFDEGFVVDGEGIIYCMKDAGASIFGGPRFTQVFSYDPQTAELKALMTLHSGGDLEWLP